MSKKVSVLKEFGLAGIKVRENVARVPSVLASGGMRSWCPDIFSLRIDADEYEERSFNGYYGLFEKFKEAVSIFFNVNSFKDAGDEIKKCVKLGIDVQSHAYYHHTYNDYESNRHNIRKAKLYFEGLGIKTKGFTAPYGRWNASLMRALEDEGYEYSSDFSYDYMGLPSYPLIKGKKSGILEIPVFPVAPELFWQGTGCDVNSVLGYYKNVLDELTKCGIPAIIYAHTNPGLPEIPALLEKIAEYAVSKIGLKPVSMTRFYEKWTNGISKRQDLSPCSVSKPLPGGDYMGNTVSRGVLGAIKHLLKNAIDFETITPDDELRCGEIRKIVKIGARKISAWKS